VDERFATDLRNEFPQISDFPRETFGECAYFTLPGLRKFKKMTQAVAVLDGENLPLPVAEIP
jgi:hypothetical protein